MNPGVIDTDSPSSPHSATGTVAAAWGIAGFIFLLIRGVQRITPQVVEASGADLDMVHWAAAAVSILVFGIGEGYVAIQKHYMPRLLSRADRLRRNPRPVYAVLAPLYCMGLIGWDVNTTTRGWSMVAAIIVMVIIVRRIASPWQEIILAGVAVALAWAAVAAIVAGIRWFRRQSSDTRAFE